MPKYIVKDTHIKHGAKGEKEARLYAPGDEIELSEDEALKLGASIELLDAPIKKKNKKEE